MAGKRPSEGEKESGDSEGKKQKTEHHNADHAPGGDASKFGKRATMVIAKMVNPNETLTGRQSELVDELLHSIFFLGEINDPKFTPEEIVTDAKERNWLKKRYPRPFQLYSSQLPRRSPMSCVLDMIVIKEGQKNEDKIKKKLQDLIKELKTVNGTVLVSSTICVSQASSDENDSVRYYGVSMSTSGSIPGKIMVAASCLSEWDSYVAGAVMTYNPNKKKKPYFDGTIELPEQVRCKAFRLTDGAEMPPCRACGNLFGLTTSETQGWAYGNCAEVESLSNLLKGEKGVREGVRTKTEKCTDADRKKAQDEVRAELNKLLPEDFQWCGKFYDPTGKSVVNN